jgi:type III pantothenate kinase
MGDGMLLAIDVGNTHTVLGLYDGTKLIHHFRIQSERGRTEDEYHVLLATLVNISRLEPEDIDASILASVVPSLTEVYEEVVGKLVGTQPVLVRPGLVRGLELDVPDPDSVGADRIANAVAASVLYSLPAVVVDLGTTTNFDVVLPGPRYAGGAIAPGLVSSAEELFRRGARLPKVEIRRPERVVGRTTTECLQSGVYFGAVGQIDGLVSRILGEIPGKKAAVIATGGLAETIARDSKTIRHVDSGLTLQGLRILESRSRSAPGT